MLNSQFESIKFTYEEEANGSIAFLDLLIIRDSLGRIEYDVYRKPTSTPRYIIGNSHHCFAHKYAAFSSMIHRLTSLPLSTNRFEKEKQYIRDLAHFNNLDDNIILNLISKRIKQQHIRKNSTLLPSGEEKNKRFMKLTYFPDATDKIKKIFNLNDIKVAYSSANYKIKNLIGSCKEKLNDLEKAGIYKISCRDCNAVYIGMTTRNLKTRLKDHQYDIRCANGKTAISRHIIQNQHTPVNEDCIELIKQINNYRELCIWEAIFIHAHRSTAVNDNDGLIDSILFQLL